MNYLRLIYIFNISVIFFVILIGQNISADQSAVIIADEIISKNNANSINAKGDVIILNHDGTKINADEITYDKKEQRIDANNNITINDLVGNTYFLNKATTLNGLDFFEGNNVKARLVDNSRIVSKNIIKQKITVKYINFLRGQLKKYHLKI